MYNFDMEKKRLTKSEILHLAKLTNLKLTDTEIEKYCQQLEETVEYVENLNELNTNSVEPTSQTTNLTDVFFEDGGNNKRGLKQDEAIDNAKNKKEGYFVVKRIM